MTTVNLSALAGAGQQFFDNNGKPLSGGKLFSYEAGTTTPQVTYTTAAGNVPHTNPIILDSAGRIPSGQVWLSAGDNYKFALTTSTDVQLATWDNITGINGTGITTVASSVAFTGFKGQVGFVSDLADDDGSDWIGFEPAGSGAVARSTQDKLRESVSVKDFGAVGDGVTDDTAAIQAAVAFAQAGYRKVFLPAGTYLVTGSIPTYTGMTFHGEPAYNAGAVGGYPTRLVNGGTNDLFVGSLNSCDIGYLRITQNTSAGHVFNTGNISRVWLHDMFCAQSNGDKSVIFMNDVSAAPIAPIFERVFFRAPNMYTRPLVDITAGLRIQNIYFNQCEFSRSITADSPTAKMISVTADDVFNFSMRDTVFQAAQGGALYIGNAGQVVLENVNISDISEGVASGQPLPPSVIEINRGSSSNGGVTLTGNRIAQGNSTNPDILFTGGSGGTIQVNGGYIGFISGATNCVYYRKSAGINTVFVNSDYSIFNEYEWRDGNIPIAERHRTSDASSNVFEVTKHRASVGASTGPMLQITVPAQPCFLVIEALLIGSRASGAGVGTSRTQKAYFSIGRNGSGSDVVLDSNLGSADWVATSTTAGGTANAPAPNATIARNGTEANTDPQVVNINVTTGSGGSTATRAVGHFKIVAAISPTNLQIS
jgi:hypothetical protein